jgi:hypothetical protein
MFGISAVLDVLVQSRRNNAAVYNVVGSTTLLISPCAVRARPQVQGRVNSARRLNECRWKSTIAAKSRADSCTYK